MDMFGRSFKAAKCKTLLRLAMSRIKLLRNKRENQMKLMRREIASLLQTGQEASARIRVEHIFREQNIMAAYEIVELFCELVIVRLPIIESQRQCPLDLKEAIASLCFAAPRCADLPELLDVRNLFGVKYGKEFVAAAAELRPNCGVNRRIIEKLSVLAPSGEVKLKLLKEIAAENNVEWDPADSEAELLKLPEDLLDGPSHFLSSSEHSFSSGRTASVFPEVPSKPPTVSPTQVVQMMPGPELNSFETQSVRSSSQSVATPSPDSDESDDERQYIPFVLPEPPGNAPMKRYTSSIKEDNSVNMVGKAAVVPSAVDDDYTSKKGGKEAGATLTEARSGKMNYKDIATAAQAAANSAEKAAAAARAAANLARSSLPKAESNSDSDDEQYEDRKVISKSTSRASRKEALKAESNSDSDDEQYEDRKVISKSSSLASRKEDFLGNFQGDVRRESFERYDMFDLNSERPAKEDARKTQDVMFPSARVQHASEHSGDKADTEGEESEGLFFDHASYHNIIKTDIKEPSYDNDSPIANSRLSDFGSLFFSEGSNRYLDRGKGSSMEPRLPSYAAVPPRFDEPAEAENEMVFSQARANYGATEPVVNKAIARNAPTDSASNKTTVNNPPLRPPPSIPSAPPLQVTKLELSRGDISRESSFGSSGSRSVHPKLPDYDSLAAHFQALKAAKR